MKLTKWDYLSILKYYNIDSKGMTELALKKNAEDILARKMCRCIKAVQKYNTSPEKRAVAICRDSVLKKKNLNNFTFTCKKKVKFNLPKDHKDHQDALIKTNPTLNLQARPRKTRKNKKMNK